MTIQDWKGDPSKLDHTYGYNDMLLTTPAGPNLPIGVRERVSAADAAGANPSAGVSDDAAERIAQPGDQLFRLPNGGLLLRRSVFMDLCTGMSRPNNTMPVSEDISRALAYFGARVQGSDPSGDQWCRRDTPGIGGVQVETPWDLGGLSNLKGIEEILARIEQVREGHMPSDIQTGDQALAKELANAIPAQALKTFKEDVAVRRERLEGLSDWYMRHPVLYTLGIAILFGLGTDIYHIARYLLIGGENPFKGDRGLTLRIAKWVKDRFGKGPNDKDPPTPGATGGGSSPQATGPVGAGALQREALFDTFSSPLVTESEGALLYRYQATTVDGQTFGLSKDVAFRLAQIKGLKFNDDFFLANNVNAQELAEALGPQPVSLLAGVDAPVSQMDAADLLNSGVTYTGAASNVPLTAAAMQVYPNAEGAGTSLDILGQLPATSVALESLPASIEGSLLSWEQISLMFARTAPAGAR